MIEVLAIALVVVAALALAATWAIRHRRTGAATVPAAPEPASPFARFFQSHPWARRSFSGLSVVLLLAAVGMLGYPLYTNLYQSRLQARLDDQLASTETAQAYRSRAVGTGDALTRIRIPALGVDVVVVEGTTASALRAGAGHYPHTPLPCEAGNVGIAGHRTTYGRPFANLDRLRVGDDIVLETPIGTCTYKVARAPFVVTPQDASVVAATLAPTLTLTTCHPKGSAAKRLIVQAALQGSPGPPA
jgi:sortase A